MHIQDFATQYLQRLKKLIDTIDLAVYDLIVTRVMDAYAREARIFVMGNGGSGATASHLACDINKGCCLDLPKKFKMMCLNDNVPTMLALANDLTYDAVFEEQLKNFLVPGDLVIGISGSGNSENVLRAVRYAANQGAGTMGWCGFEGGRLAQLADLSLVVRSNDMQQIEDVHMILSHMLMQTVFNLLHADGCACRD